jgi:hypothetical protein
MRKPIAEALLVVVLLAEFYGLSGMGYIVSNPSRFADDILMFAEHEHHDMNAAPTTTAPEGHPVNSAETKKDNR